MGVPYAEVRELQPGDLVRRGGSWARVIEIVEGSRRPLVRARIEKNVLWPAQSIEETKRAKKEGE